jgi:hypothetical protein
MALIAVIDWKQLHSELNIIRFESQSFGRIGEYSGADGRRDSRVRLWCGHVPEG